MSAPAWHDMQTPCPLSCIPVVPACYAFVSQIESCGDVCLLAAQTSIVGKLTELP